MDLPHRQLALVELAVLEAVHAHPHSDTDSMVLFRKADVMVTGDVVDLRSFPVIDPKMGGTIQGELDALNRLLTEFVVPNLPLVLKPGRTLVVPGHGYIADYGEVVEYRWEAAVGDEEISAEEFERKRTPLNLVVDHLAGSVIKRLADGRSDGVALLAEGLADCIVPDDLRRLTDLPRDEHGEIHIAEVNLGDALKEAVEKRLLRRQVGILGTPLSEGVTGDAEVLVVEVSTVAVLVTTSPGTIVPNGAKVPGTPYQLDPVSAAFNIGAIAGTATWGRLSEGRLGRRGAFTLTLILGPASLPFFLYGGSTQALVLGALTMGFFGMGVWGMAPAYTVERFPTQVRGVGPGFCYHAGAAMGALMPWLLGEMQDRGISAVNGMSATMVASAVLAMIAVWIGPETRGRDFND